MTSPKAKKSLSNLEIEHDSLKLSLYKNSAIVWMRVLQVTSIVEVIRSLYYSQLSIMLPPLLVLVSSVLLLRVLSNLENNIELVISMFHILFYVGILSAHYLGDSGYFNNISDVFFFTYTYAQIERLVVNRIPSARYKAIYSGCSALARVIIIPSNDKGSLVIHFSVLALTIYLDVNKEKSDSKLFASYSRSKDQLGKFKNLVEYYIPESIVIVSRNLTQHLFINDAFKALLGVDSTSNVRTQLSRFELSETLVTNQNTSSRLCSSNQTLLTLLESKMSAEQEGPAIENKSYHLSFRKSDSVTLKPYKEDQTFEVKILDIVWDEHPAFAVVLHDITQQQTILQLKVAADANKDKILATVSHELRTPLNGILGMIQIMSRKLQDQELLQYLDICKNSAHLLLGLVNSILDLNQIRVNKLKLNYEKIDLQDLMKDISSLFEFQCNQKNIVLSLLVFSKVPKHIVTDKNRLSQIFINLIGNALKFTSKGSITIKVQQEHGELIKFTVEDTGIGIKHKDQNKLFKMFGRLDQEDDTINQQGVGLGLTISNNLAQLLCGNEELGGIQVESEYKKGSSFSFRIKRNLNPSCYDMDMEEDTFPSLSSFTSLDDRKNIEARVKSYPTQPIKNVLTDRNLSSSRYYSHTLDMFYDKKAKTQTHFQDISYPGSFKTEPNATYLSQSISPLKVTPTILIVDDNPFNVTVATHLISCYGLNVKSAFSGETTVDLVLNNNHKTEPIQLILMDCQMPIMDGYETTKILRDLVKEGKVPDIPIVALTANDNLIDREKCMKAGMCDYLTKPLTERSLIKVLKKYSVINTDKSVYK